MTQKQLAFILARQRVILETADETLQSIIANNHLSEHFIALAKDLEVYEAKTPEDIYKTHLENTRTHLLFFVL
jgi:26S proteasome regulatory subunit N1